MQRRENVAARPQELEQLIHAQAGPIAQGQKRTTAIEIVGFSKERDDLTRDRVGTVRGGPLYKIVEGAGAGRRQRP